MELETNSNRTVNKDTKHLINTIKTLIKTLIKTVYTLYSCLRRGCLL